MTKYRIFSLIAAALAVGVGFVYLLFGETSLSFVLPLLALCFWLITLFSYWEARKAGVRGFFAWLPALAMGLAAAAATFGALAFLALSGG